MNDGPKRPAKKVSHAHKVEGVLKKLSTQTIEEWVDSSRGRKKIDDIATQSARKVSGV